MKLGFVGRVGPGGKRVRKPRRFGQASLRTRRANRLVSVLGICLSLAACGSDDGTGTDGGIAGTYVLTTVNGASLPFTCFFDAVAIMGLDITAGSLALTEAGQFGGSLTTRETVGANITTENETLSGTYTQSGNTIQFSDATSGSFTGTLSGNSITILEDDYVDDGCPILTLIYSK